MDRAAPVLWLLAGPNGAGKSTYYERFVATRLRAPFVNADRIALATLGRHPRTEEEMQAAAELAARQRSQLIEERRSFVAETVFSHMSKLELMQRALAAGFYVRFSYIGVATPALCASRVQARVAAGGHDVPLDRIAARYARSLAHAVRGVAISHVALVIDNSSSREPYRKALRYESGRLIAAAEPRAAWLSRFSD